MKTPLSSNYYSLIIEQYIIDHYNNIDDILMSTTGDLIKAINTIVLTLSNKGIVLAAGNGGSASDVDHFVAELSGRFKRERRGYPAINLMGQTASLTAISNDYGYDMYIARQLNAFAYINKVVVLASTSGTSQNIVNAVNECIADDFPCIVFTSSNKWRALGHSVLNPLVIFLKGENPAEVQENTIKVFHAMAATIEYVLECR